VIPAVSELAAGADRYWLADHPQRRYHLRPGWVIRARGRGVFLRATVTLPSGYPDIEAAAEAAWWSAAFPSQTPECQQKMAKTPRRRLGQRRPAP
jgi:hypothetical protein